MSETKDVAIKLYRNVNIESDFCIQLIHSSDDVQIGGSTLALQVASVANTLGLVNHTIWLEQKEIQTNKQLYTKQS